MTQKLAISLKLPVVLLGMLASQLVAQSPLQVEQSEAEIKVSQGNQPILTYNVQSPPAPSGIDPVFERSGFLHPVYTPTQACVTAAFPADHMPAVVTEWPFVIQVFQAMVVEPPDFRVFALDRQIQKLPSTKDPFKLNHQVEVANLRLLRWNCH